MAVAGCTGPKLNRILGPVLMKSVLFPSQPHRGQRSVSPLLSVHPILTRTVSRLLLRLCWPLYPVLTFPPSSLATDPPQILLLPFVILQPLFLRDSPLRSSGILPLSLPLFPSFLPLFLIPVSVSCFS